MGSKFLTMLAGLGALSLSACATEPSPALLLLTSATDARPYGDFLSARYANLTRDSEAATFYFDRAFASAPGDSQLFERALLTALLAGDVARVDALSVRVLQGAQGPAWVRLAAAAHLLRNNDAAGARSVIGPAVSSPDADDVERLLAAWATLGADGVEAALPMLEPQRPRARVDALMMQVQGLMLAASGRDAEALGRLQAAWDAGGRGIGGVEALIRLRAASGDVAGALNVHAQFVDETGLDEPVLAAAAQDATSGKAAPVRLTAAQGAARSLADLSALTGRANGAGTVLLTLALQLDPALDSARVRLARDLIDTDVPAQAQQILAQVGEASGYRPLARLEEAFIHENAGDTTGAVAQALDAVRGDPARDVRMRAGQLLEAAGMDAEAEALFDSVVQTDSAAGHVDWRALFRRAAARERLGRWDAAESDLEAALALAPDQPEVLNYLGFSWIDRGENVEAGLRLVERAARARPEEGYIIDSLGWAFFRLGRYQDAVDTLERASELAAADPDINDHLGDAYWKVGRKIEAEYQWRRVLTLDADTELAESARRKLAMGLEGARVRTLADAPPQRQVGQ